MIKLNLKQRQYLLTKDSNLTYIVIINFEQVTWTHKLLILLQRFFLYLLRHEYFPN